MFDFLRTQEPRQFIDGGRVYCPNRSADVEFDVCFGCRWMEQIDQDAELPFVRCEPQPRALIYGEPAKPM